MNRRAGVLMPVSSLPSRYGIGTLGREAYRFVDFLQGAGCRIWQVLPLQPTSYGDSPYSSCAADALNYYFIDLDLLAEQGLLRRGEYAASDWGSDKRRVDYGKLYERRIPVLHLAFSRFDRTAPEWRAFLEEGRFRDFALFMAIKQHFCGAPHEAWKSLSSYGHGAEQFAREHRDEVEFWQFTQYLFLAQWRALKVYANARGVEIMGDMPIYVARDSVEMWKYGKELFLPRGQAGVPPDDFSATGQLWGNPLYDWERMKRDGYSWWHRRIARAFELYDILRIDHFIGFVRCYCIPDGARDATEGVMRSGPGAALFKGFESAQIVAEDLGIVTDEVRAAIRETGYPGMKILQHAFNEDPCNEHKPSNYEAHIVAYTGTHDNETLLERVSATHGRERTVMERSLREEAKRAGVRCDTRSDRAICNTMLRLLYASRAETVIFPLQDALPVAKEGRINKPSTVSPENWTYRFVSRDFSASLQAKLRALAERSGRLE